MERMNVAIIEDNDETVAQLKDYCSEIGDELSLDINPLTYASLKAFVKGIKRISPDLLIVDLRLGQNMNDRSGWKAVEKILKNEIVPVVVYSAFSEEEPDSVFRNALIVRVTKGEAQVERFKNVLTRSVRIKLKFNQERQRVIAEFTKLSLETVKELLGEENIEDMNENLLAAMAISRLSSYLCNVPLDEDHKFPPESAFIYPPLEIPPYPRESLILGDFLEKSEDDNSRSLWLVVSPSCDTVFSDGREKKIEEVLLLHCYRTWEEVPFLKDKNKSLRKGELNTRLGRNTVEIVGCPSGIFKSKYILLSLKDYKTLPYNEIKHGLEADTWKRIATLATPYAESFQNLFIRDLSRIGTPDIATNKEKKRWVTEFVG